MDVTFEDIMYIGRRDFEFASDCGECKGVVTEGFYDKEISCIGDSAILVNEVECVCFYVTAIRVYTLIASTV